MYAQHCVFVGDGGSNEHYGTHANGMTPLCLTYHLKEEPIRCRQSTLQGKIAEQFTSLDSFADWLAKYITRDQVGQKIKGT